MSDESFLQYLLSFDNLIINPTILDLYMDMNKPLAHYFIASSHNTYLTGLFIEFKNKRNFVKHDGKEVLKYRDGNLDPPTTAET